MLNECSICSSFTLTSLTVSVLRIVLIGAVIYFPLKAVNGATLALDDDRVVFNALFTMGKRSGDSPGSSRNSDYIQRIVRFNFFQVSQCRHNSTNSLGAYDDRVCRVV